MSDTKEQNKMKPHGIISEEIEEGIEKLPNMEVAELRFQYRSKRIEGDKKTILEKIEEFNMAPFYEDVCKEFGWPVDRKLLEKMEIQNTAELNKLESQLTDATENLGDLEVLEIQYSKAKLYSQIGDKNAALASFKNASEKPQSVNQKIQVALHIIRIGMFHEDDSLVKEYIDKAKVLIDEGGDWDRRNRLKVYEACYLLLSRDFQKASLLFLDSVATFTSYELLPYKRMIFYTIITSVLSQNRVDLKKKVVDCPEVLAVLNEGDNKLAGNLLNGLYDCKYKQFFHALVDLHPVILHDKYLSPHSNFLYRELRVLSYSQFLEAYRSVTIQSMASTFGVSIDFLDRELSRFIAAGRVNARIDKVGGVIETNRPDSKSAQYQAVIKQGDFLLNRVQKLARVINV